MLFSVEQAFVGRDEKRAPLKMPEWEASFAAAANHLNVFVIRFTVALVNKQICANAHLTENLSVAVERSSD